MGFWGNLYGRIRKALLPACRAIKATFKYTLGKISAASRAVIDYAIENPWKFGLISALIVGGILIIVVLPAVGFVPGGIMLGSAAAAWQSSIGIVAAGSLFAVLQSLAMTGVMYVIGGVMILVGMLIPVIAHYWNKWFGGKGDDGENGDDKKDK